jgi:signal transduction histidine kinase
VDGTSRASRSEAGEVVSEIVRTTHRATRILDDLLDLTRSSFGTDIPVEKCHTDLAALWQEIADELRGINESCRVEKGRHNWFLGRGTDGTGALQPDGQCDPVQQCLKPGYCHGIGQGSRDRHREGA